MNSLPQEEQLKHKVEEKSESTMSKRQVKKAERQRQRKVKNVLKVIKNNTAYTPPNINNKDNDSIAAVVATDAISSADLSVQHTNDDSVLSKRSAVAMNYFHDAFLRYFVKRPTRRSPLINRGYYLRMAVITDLVESIVTYLYTYLSTTLITNQEAHNNNNHSNHNETNLQSKTEEEEQQQQQQEECNVSSCPIQVISLGAGFDTLAFRLISEETAKNIKIMQMAAEHHNKNTNNTDNSNRDNTYANTNKELYKKNVANTELALTHQHNVYYYDVDFPAVMVNKAACMAAAPVGTFPSTFLYNTANSKHPIQSKHYHAIGADLRVADDCTDHWIHCLLEECTACSCFALHHPTLIYMECVTQYLSTEACNNLFHSIATHFPHALLLSYDQIHPFDSFGKVMCHSLRQRGSPLLGINQAWNGTALARRALQCGMEEAYFANFFDVANTYICDKERQRINALEPFDEIEEWSEMCDHYGLTLSTTAKSTSLWSLTECCKQLKVPFHTLHELSNNTINVDTTDKSDSAGECVVTSCTQSKMTKVNTQENLLEINRRNWPSGRFAFEGWGHGEAWVETLYESTYKITNSTENKNNNNNNNNNNIDNNKIIQEYDLQQEQRQSVIISFGGFAATKSHGRVNTVYCHSLRDGELTTVDATMAVNPHTEQRCLGGLSNTVMAPPLIFHTFTRLAPLTYLVIGGRSNPREVNHRAFLLRCDVEQNVMSYVWSELTQHITEAASSSACPSARYRHNVVLVSEYYCKGANENDSNATTHNNAEVFICGGKDKDGNVRGDAWLGEICVRTQQITWRQIYLHTESDVTMTNDSASVNGNNENGKRNGANRCNGHYERQCHYNAFPSLYSAAATRVAMSDIAILSTAHHDNATHKQTCNADQNMNMTNNHNNNNNNNNNKEEAKMCNTQSNCVIIISGGLDERDECNGNVWLIYPRSGLCLFLSHLNVGPRFAHSMTLLEFTHFDENSGNNEINSNNNNNNNVIRSQKNNAMKQLLVLGGCVGTRKEKEENNEKFTVVSDDACHSSDPFTSSNVKNCAVLIDLPNLSHMQWITLDQEICPSIARHSCVPLCNFTPRMRQDGNNVYCSATVAVIGGGYTCFSFGTFTTKPFLLDITMHNNHCNNNNNNNNNIITNKYVFTNGSSIYKKSELAEITKASEVVTPLQKGHTDANIHENIEMNDKLISAMLSKADVANNISSSSSNNNKNNNNNSETHNDNINTAPFTWASLLSSPRPAVQELLYSPDVFRRVAAEANRPVIFRNVDLGPCVRKWREPSYLCSAEKNTIVSVHVAEGSILLDFVRKNFSFKHVRFEELVEHLLTATQTFEEHGTLLPEIWYYRSIAAHMKSERSNVWHDFNVLSKDFILPAGAHEVIMPRLHQSCLRLNAAPLQLWNHYDTFDNVLCQIVGSKRVVMFPPSAYNNLYMTGSSSSVMDMDAPDLVRYPRFIDACKSATEVIINPGDMLYFPANWFHHITTLPSTKHGDNINNNNTDNDEAKEVIRDPYSISVNVFYEHFAKDEYDPKDLYGNKDILACVALRKSIVDEVKKRLSEATLHSSTEQLLPPEYSEFALREAIQDLEQIAENMSAARRTERKLSSRETMTTVTTTTTTTITPTTR